MALKRGLVDEVGNDSPQYQATQQRNQRLKFTKCLCKDKFWLQEYSAQLENVFRKVVREEVEVVVQRYSHSNSRTLLGQAEAAKSRKFKLQFEGKIPSRLFTENRVEAEGPSPIKVALVDALSGLIIKDGPLSAAKVKIVVLQGHFKAEQLDDWTKEEFKKNILSARDGRRPLLVGEHVIYLRDGIGYTSDICITDNSSWVRSKKFRLGAEVEGKEDLVREGVSSSFEVKDRRGENYQKHDIPSPEDDVWRLYGIAKDGKICKRLAEYQIYKVKDFLSQYLNDESLLRNILDVSPKKWEVIVQRATSCLLLPQFYEPLDIQAPQFNALQHSRDQLDEPLVLNKEPAAHSDSLVSDNLLVTDLVGESCDDGHGRSLDNFMAPSSATCPLYGQDMFDDQASGWFPCAPSIWEKDYGILMGYSSGNSHVGLLSSFSNVVVNSPEIAKPKAGWSKIRAVWRILVKHDEATVQKGKFPCYNQ